MTLRIQSGRMTITRAGGETLFNTDDKMLHITNVLEKTIAVPTVTGGAKGSGGPGTQNLTTYYDIGAVNEFATQIIGAVKFVVTGTGDGLAYNRWHMMMGGTVIWVMDGAGLTKYGVTTNGSLSQLCTYHFEIVSGRCRLVRRVVIGTGFLYSIKAHSIQCKLRAGAWV